MPFVPFKKKDADSTGAPGAPAFTKKSAKRKRKPGKVASAQKSMMQSGRALGGGGR